MHSRRVGRYLRVSLWMFRYHTTQRGYSIGFYVSTILLFRALWMRFAFSVCNKLTRLNSVENFILSITVMKVSATLCVVATRIRSRADTSEGYLWGGVVWISNRRWGTELYPWSGNPCRSSLTMPGKLFWAKITHSLRVIPHKMDSGNPITSISVSDFQIIASATEVKFFRRPISSATSAPTLSASQTHLLTMNQMARTWCARNLVLGRPRNEFLWPGTRLSVEWQIGWAFSSLTGSSRNSYSNLLFIVLRTVFNTELVFSGSRTSSSSSTSSWSSYTPFSVFFSSLMISFSCSDVSRADGFIFWCFWN